MADGDVIEGQRVNSGVQLHDKPRAPSRQTRAGRNEKGGFLTQVLVDIKYLYYLNNYLRIFSILKIRIICPTRL